MPEYQYPCPYKKMNDTAVPKAVFLYACYCLTLLQLPLQLLLLRPESIRGIRAGVAQPIRAPNNNRKVASLISLLNVAHCCVLGRVT